MKIYLAGTFTDQLPLRDLANQLWLLGHEVVGTWLQETAKTGVLTKAEQWRKLAVKDVAEIYSADLIILDNRQLSGGKNVEWGIAVGCFHKKLLWLVGEPTNIFHELADEQFDSWEECYEYLTRTQER